MFTLLAPLLWLLSATQDHPAGDPAQRLLESAGARAGHNPRQASELREAASAWLRVVR